MVGKRSNVMGVGCFAAEPTLARVLRKMVAAYSLGDCQAAMASAIGDSKACDVLHRLMSEVPAAADRNGDGGADGRIAGFFLGLENQRLKLAVFIRRNGRSRLQYTAILDELSDLRRKRLH